MGVNIAICEDNKDDAALLQKLLEAWMIDQQMTAEITLFQSGEALLEAYCHNRFDLLFMDVYLECKNGIKTCEIIRKTDLDCVIIFTTVSDSHALEGFAVGAIHYLLKPVTEQALEDALRRCKGLVDTAARCLNILENREPVHIFWRDIRYIEVYGNSSIIHTAQGDISVHMTLDSLLEKLDSPPFLRCHRSFIVNLQHTQKLRAKDFLLKDDGEIPVGRAYRERSRQGWDYYLSNVIQRTHAPQPVGGA